MLKVENLTVSYGSVRALRNASLEVNDGELLAILGANGAGKSTLLRTISGLVRPQAGAVRFGGQDITNVSADRVARMGIAHVPEGRRIFPGLTVEQNLILGAGLRRDRNGLQEDFVRVYQLFPVLADRRGQDGWSLSGGQQQMLAVGRALMGRPRVLMLDEPSLGLAPKLVQQVLAAVRAICDAGTPILLVEQNARGALRIADRALVLRTGAIVHEGLAHELREDDRMRETYLGA